MTEADTLAAQLNKKLGAGTIIKGSDLANMAITRMSTGSLVLDVVLGGGWVQNQWNEVIGDESSGKTTTVLKAIAANQAADPAFEVLWIAAEDLDPEWVVKLGCDLTRMHIAPTNVMEEAYQTVIDFIEKQAVDCVVIDSLPALVPGDEDTKDVDEFTVALGAKVTNKFFRKVAAAGKRSMVEVIERPCTGILINQYRMKIGVMRGDPRTTPGGMGKNYAYWTRLELARVEWLKHKDEKVGIRIKGRTIKNKSAPAQREGMVDFYFADAPGFNQGDYDVAKDVINIALVYEVIERSGAWYTYRDKKWNGRDPIFVEVPADPELRRQIEHDVLVAIGAAEPTPDVTTKKAGIRRRK